MYVCVNYCTVKDSYAATELHFLHFTIFYSAGVGRTGTFITLDIVLRQIKAEKVVDIHNTINKLRYQRPQMVQSLVRYCVFL